MNAPSEKTSQTFDRLHARKLRQQIQQLLPLHTPKDAPLAGDWLDEHEEDGQSFEQYLRCRPIRPIGRRTQIYILPIGRFTPMEDEILAITAAFMEAWFQRSVLFLDPLPLKTIPPQARRMGGMGMEQLLTSHLLDEALIPALPSDGACILGFTAMDLWPGEGWNYVFGEAYRYHRAGVWSMARHGDPSLSDEDYQLCLMRTMKTAVHETGHLFSMDHCITHECNMGGSNHLEESDRSDVWLCPACAAKVCWATRSEMTDRYWDLKAFYDRYAFDRESQFMRHSLETLLSLPGH